MDQSNARVSFNMDVTSSAISDSHLNAGSQGEIVYSQVCGVLSAIQQLVVTVSE